MNWGEIVSWLLLFFMGCCAGSHFEMARLILASDKGEPLSARGRTFSVREIIPPP